MFVVVPHLTQAPAGELSTILSSSIYVKWYVYNNKMEIIVLLKQLLEKLFDLAIIALK